MRRGEQRLVIGFAHRRIDDGGLTSSGRGVIVTGGGTAREAKTGSTHREVRTRGVLWLAAGTG